MKKISLLPFLFLSACSLMDTNKTPNPSMAATKENAAPDPIPVPSLDLKKFSGLWTEFAHSPNFHKDCVQSMTTFKLRRKNSMDILVSCQHANGTKDYVTGKAYQPDSTVGGLLRLDFDLFGSAEYRVVILPDNYKWAVISGSDTSTYMILTRSQPIPPKQLEGILGDMSRRGYNSKELIFNQPAQK